MDAAGSATVSGDVHRLCKWSQIDPPNFSFDFMAPIQHGILNGIALTAKAASAIRRNTPLGLLRKRFASVPGLCEHRMYE